MRKIFICSTGPNDSSWNDPCSEQLSALRGSTSCRRLCLKVLSTFQIFCVISNFAHSKDLFFLSDKRCFDNHFCLLCCGPELWAGFVAHAHIGPNRRDRWVVPWTRVLLAQTRTLSTFACGPYLLVTCFRHASRIRWLCTVPVQDLTMLPTFRCCYHHVVCPVGASLEGPQRMNVLWTFVLLRHFQQASVQAALQGSPGRHCALAHFFSPGALLGFYPRDATLAARHQGRRQAAREATLEHPSCDYLATCHPTSFCASECPHLSFEHRRDDASIGCSSSNLWVS